jgi:beta-glucosidase
MTVQLPDGFLWGAATAAHQVEGGNVNSDWWRLEHAPDTRVVEPSGDACDSYHRYGEDIALLAEAGLGAYRFSVEWARIEPAPGKWSAAALGHYRRMCETCLAAGVTPLVTLHHFTFPRWLAAAGGWGAPDIVERFAAHATRVAEALGDLLGWVCTINEPNLLATYRARALDEDDVVGRRRIAEVYLEAHHAGVAAVRAVDPSIKTGITLALPDLQALDGGEERCRRMREETQDTYLEACAGDDFIGVQTYTRELFGPDGPAPVPDGAATTLTGWEVHPEALEASIRHAWETSRRTPIMVTENGIATADDDDRVAYTDRALAGVRRCIADGIDVRGYLHWSLLDNFEWWHGYRPTFGLIAVDRTTFVRTPKPSLAWLGRVASGG